MPTNFTSSSTYNSPTKDPSAGPEHNFNFEEYLIDMIERERREWDDERAKLKFCIYLQEQELNEKAAAAEERAQVLTKEFMEARTQSEERLNTISNNIYRDIRDLQSISQSVFKHYNYKPSAGKGK